MKFDPHDVFLALKFYEFFMSKYPDMVKLFEEGDAENPDFMQLLPKSKEELKAEIDAFLMN